ncbi:ABC transporter substrate-binding protein [Azoarcus sp. TTM-91]|uniref:ABC transporter substrate-binding protein n=1 Tax=Azoarcus sp. TTM-91 TaxID=2691581 RepID=UPI00145D105D|nr:ABC transporter substrate-binding protein [Azoarcus sp. TTM-91]NMG33097.1 ABC transporter substrate-binding protein [Azoarcus sp. TTM-91]
MGAGRGAGWRRLAAGVLAVAAVLAAGACAKPEPVRIGFIGSLSGRFSDASIEARSGVLMALDDANASQSGRRFELVVRDDGQQPETAQVAMKALIDAGVVAVIGPMTSSVAEVVVPMANEAGVTLLSPSVTGSQLQGKDDYFLRVVSTAHTYGSVSARYFLQAEGSRRVALITDEANAAYTADWADSFESAFTAGGGSVVRRESFRGDTPSRLRPQVERILAARPDLVVAVASVVDVSRIARLVRAREPRLRLAASEWAATEQLMEIGGRAVEGMYVPQFFDRDSSAPAYIAFRRSYIERFQVAPGIVSVAAYDAAHLLLDTLREAPDASRAEVRRRLLAHGGFDGLQHRVALDAYGDSRRDLFMAVVRVGQYRKVALLDGGEAR